MQNIVNPAVCIDEKAASTVNKQSRLTALWYLFYPVGVFKIWKGKRSGWIKLVYSVLYLPVFLLLSGYLGILLFAAFLPPLDCSVGNRTDRAIINREGNYAARFLKTGKETGGAYELVEVELEPYGGNDWHYHNRFTEQFTVLEGRVHIGQNGKELLLDKGKTITASKRDMHFFKNALDSKSVLQVKIAPAAGLEKTLRVAYGLINDGLLKNEMTRNPWHMALLLAYSESYLPGMPSWFQEPLINSLAKIAQWKGEDRVLYRYFK